MVSCKHCQTPNSLDSTFCKRCGTAIADVELQEAQAKLEKLIEEGNALFNQGRIDEALAIAESATASNPSSTSALSLKVLCHERRGEIAEALECADRLVELNPDSEFDRIRRATLRQKLQTDLHIPAAPDRRLAVVGATAAIVLVLCLGAIAARMNGTDSAKDTRTAMNDVPVNGFTNPSTSLTNPGLTSGPAATKEPAANPQPNPTNPQNSTPEGIVTRPTPGTVPNLGSENSTQTNPAPNSQNLGSFRPRSGVGGQTLPDPSNMGGGVGDTEIRPEVPNVPEGLVKQTPSSGSKQTSPSPDESPTFEKPNSPPAEKPKEDPGGFMEINVRRGSAPRSTGGSEPINGNGLEALVRVGSQQFQMGNYAGAAKSYEQAVRSGGDGIILNRRLAQAYERLGRNSDAADAYRRCISAIDSAINAGRGNKDTLSNTKAVCEQALKVLQGG